MIIDTHVHLIRPFDSQGRPQVYSPGNETSAEGYVALMEQAGTDRAFFISWSPEDIPSDLRGKSIPVESVRETINREYALDAMARFPERFYWFPCHLGPLLGDATAMARENLSFGAAGLKLVCSFWGELPDDARLMPLYELAAEAGGQVIIDTSFWYLGKDEPQVAESLQPGHREVAQRISDFADYVTHLEPILTAFPSVHFQLAHAGARSFTPGHAAEVARLMRRNRNVYADLGAIATDSPVLDQFVAEVGAGRVMFGTDWPHFAQGEAMARAIAAVRRPGRFSEAEARLILGEAALQFVNGRPSGLREC